MADDQRVDVDRAKALLKRRVLGAMPKAGDYESGLAGVRMYRRDETTKPQPCLYQPMIVKMVQGHKRVFIGAEEYRYGEAEVMVTGVDMPGANMFCEASPDSPSLTINIDLDRNLLAQLALEIPYKPFEAGGVVRGMHVQPFDADLLDAYLRLTGLFNIPERLPILGPMIVREIHYLLLMGPNGHRLRSFHTAGSQDNHVARAILWMKQNLAVTMHIEELAEKVNMAPSTFHRHFKAVTTLSPVQFQKRIRLYEAQRLMLTQDMDAGSASSAVGYESLSQFTREYKRLFGNPPRKDVTRLREEALFARPVAIAGNINPRGF
ncbi:MAG: AraC family transcriptional regulator [Deltaproteobacteria bacterium]|jgi:AraC-like DNA-binding protein|nr:AraC family transcriptional regulator [Deltaproteobacteria bacterium]